MKQLMQLNICTTGKKSFKNEEHAAGAVERASTYDGGEGYWRVYICPLCKQYHLTRQRPRSIKV